MRFMSNLLLSVVAICVLFLAGHKTEAAPPAGTAVYVWRADLGGWLDTSTNLVWGYSATSISGSNYSFNYANTTLRANYATLLTNSGYPAEGAAAAQHTNWRLPALNEYQGAWNKGFFTTGADGFNYDTSPAMGYQGPPYGNGLNWTTTPGAGKNKNSIYLFNIIDGGNMIVSKTSSVQAILVRTHLP